MPALPYREEKKLGASARRRELGLRVRRRLRLRRRGKVLALEFRHGADSSASRKLAPRHRRDAAKAWVARAAHCLKA